MRIPFCKKCLVSPICNKKCDYLQKKLDMLKTVSSFSFFNWFFFGFVAVNIILIAIYESMEKVQIIGIISLMVGQVLLLILHILARKLKDKIESKFDKGF